MLLHPSIPVHVTRRRATIGVDPAIVLETPTRMESVWLEHVGRHSPIPDPPSKRCARVVAECHDREWLVTTVTPLESLHVAVVGGGALATTIGIGLAHAGAGRLSFRDYVPTHPLDSWAYAPTTPRELSAAQAAAWTVARQGGASIVHPERPADVTVVTGYAVPDRATMLDLMAADATHVYALASHRAVEVGPWVEPGRSPCWWCITNRRMREDSDWAERTRVAHVTERPWCDPPVAWAATAQLLRWFVAWSAGADVTGQVARVTLPGLEFRSVSPHPDCGCGEPQCPVPRLQTG